MGSNYEEAAYYNSTNVPLSWGLFLKNLWKMSLSSCSRSSSSSGVDRISGLPDELLIQILSCLPTKDAVATSVLSKRWTHLFSLLTTLEFDDSPISHCARCPNQIDRFSTFNKFVCDALRSCHSSVNLTKFTLRFGRRAVLFNAPDLWCCPSQNNCYPDLEYPLLNSWLCFPLSRGVRELDLDFNVREPGKLPWEIFTCETLEVLRINVNLSFDPPKLLPMSFHLPNLKKLHFLSLDYHPVSGFLTPLLSSCPSLEDLSIFHTHRPYPDKIYISSPSLRRLFLAYHFTNDPIYIPNALVVLDTPNLLYFSYDDTILADRYDVGNMNAALVEFCLSIDSSNGHEEVEYQKIQSLLKTFSNVKHLSLLSECNEFLQYGLPKDKLPVFNNLRSLHLGFGFFASWDIVLLEMLKCSPFLETLSFPKGLTCYRGYVFDSAEREAQRWCTTCTTREIPSCLRSHIKRIIIKFYRGTEREDNLIRFLLRKASVLEELYIYAVPKYVNGASLENRLMQLPRASNMCSVKVCLADEDAQSFMWPPQAAEALSSVCWRGSY